MQSSRKLRRAAAPKPSVGRAPTNCKYLSRELRRESGEESSAARRLRAAKSLLAAAISTVRSSSRRSIWHSISRAGSCQIDGRLIRSPPDADVIESDYVTTYD